MKKLCIVLLGLFLFNCVDSINTRLISNDSYKDHYVSLEGDECLISYAYKGTGSIEVTFFDSRDQILHKDTHTIYTVDYLARRDFYVVIDNSLIAYIRFHAVGNVLVQNYNWE